MKYICIKEFTYGTFNSKLWGIYYFDIDGSIMYKYSSVLWYKSQEANYNSIPQYILDEDFELYSVHRNKKIQCFLD